MRPIEHNLNSLREIIRKLQDENTIYDGKDYMEVFERDLIEANREVVISSPDLRRSKVERMMSLMKGRQEAGVEVTIITLEPEMTRYGNIIEQRAFGKKQDVPASRELVF